MATIQPGLFHHCPFVLAAPLPALIRAAPARITDNQPFPDFFYQDGLFNRFKRAFG